MSNLSIARELKGTPDSICLKVEASLKEAGFGILTRIDFDQKIHEKLGETIPRTIILGACNPRLAYNAYQQSTDVALLIPCNVVLRETTPGYVMVEIMRPTKMLEFLKEVRPDPTLIEIENKLATALKTLAE